MLNLYNNQLPYEFGVSKYLALLTTAISGKDTSVSMFEKSSKKPNDVPQCIYAEKKVNEAT